MGAKEKGNERECGRGKGRRKGMAKGSEMCVTGIPYTKVASHTSLSEVKGEGGDNASRGREENDGI